MGVTASRVRELALGLAGASEAVHFDRTAFRTVRKMFATLGAGGGDLNLLFTPELRDFYCDMAPLAFSPVPGGWGAKGATRCDLGVVDEATLCSALLAAHGLAVPRGRGGDGPGRFPFLGSPGDEARLGWRMFTPAHCRAGAWVCFAPVGAGNDGLAEAIK